MPAWREEAAARSAAELLARGRQMLGLGKGVIAARSQPMEDELDPLEKHEAENYEASWDAHIRRRALAAALKRTYEAGWEKGGGKGEGFQGNCYKCGEQALRAKAKMEARMGRQDMDHNGAVREVGTNNPMDSSGVQD